MTARQYRKWQELLAKAGEFHTERRYRTEERMGILYGTERASRRRVVVVHEVMKEMDQLHW